MVMDRTRAREIVLRNMAVMFWNSTGFSNIFDPFLNMRCVIVRNVFLKIFY